MAVTCIIKIMQRITLCRMRSRETINLLFFPSPSFTIDGESYAWM